MCETERRPGDIFLTRWADEEKNTTPGHWNHAAILMDGWQIVEAQMAPNTVLVEDFDVFWNRYAEIVVLRVNHVLGHSIGLRMASNARLIVGSPYRKIASGFNFLRRSGRGENCVSVVRKCYRDAVGDDPGWTYPDDIAKKHGRIFTVVSRK